MVRRHQSSRSQRTSESQSEAASFPSTPRTPAAPAPAHPAESDSDESSDGEGDAILRQYLMVLSNKEESTVRLFESELNLLYFYTLIWIPLYGILFMCPQCEFLIAWNRTSSFSESDFLCVESRSKIWASRSATYISIVCSLTSPTRRRSRNGSRSRCSALCRASRLTPGTTPRAQTLALTKPIALSYALLASLLTGFSQSNLLFLQQH